MMPHRGRAHLDELRRRERHSGGEVRSHHVPDVPFRDLCDPRLHLLRDPVQNELSEDRGDDHAAGDRGKRISPALLPCEPAVCLDLDCVRPDRESMSGGGGGGGGGAEQKDGYRFSIQLY